MKSRWLLVSAFAAMLKAEVKLPPYQREVLPNGVVVYLLHKTGVPLVDFRIILKGGIESEPAGLAGIANVSAQLLRKGTPSRSADQFSDELDGLGGTFRETTNEQATVITSEFLSKDFEAGLNLTADAVLHAAFPDSEVKKLLAQDIDGAKAIKDNPQAAMRGYFSAFFYGPNHPYGKPSDEVSMTHLTRDNIADYVKRTYVGRNMVVVVSGAFDEKAAAASVKRVFGELASGQPQVFGTSKELVTGQRLLLIDKPDATQTYFRIALPGISRTDPNRTSLLLVNTLFGGRFTSMLNDELRVNSGLTYGASCILELNHEPGAIDIASYTRTDTTEKAMDLALDVLKRLNEKGISAEQLASVKAYVKGLFPTQNLETADQIAGVLGDMEVFGLNRGEVDDLFSRIDSVTLEQANATAKRWYQPQGLTFVVLGNAAQIRGVVKKYAPQMQEVSIKTAGYAVR